MRRFPARRLAAGGGGAAAAGCAHMEAPPGGPEDKAAPQLLTVRPDTMARLESFSGPVVFVFDETLSEEGVETAVEVSPRNGGISIDQSGEELRVNLRRGWQRGRIYQVTVAPGIRDRFGNIRTDPIRLVFSTGPAIPDTRITGRVVQRTTLQPLRGARVEAILRADSLVYAAETDSAGAFVLEQVPEGEYLVRAFTDQNRSRALDSYEARDSAVLQVAAASPGEARLSVIAPDTTGPALGTASGTETVVELRFDDFLDPAQPLRPEQVEIRAADGRAVRVTEVRVGAFPGARGAADSAGAPAAAQARPAQPAPADTGRARADSAAVPTPSQSLFARTAEALAPESEYTVRATGVRNLLGLVGGGEAKLRTPRPAPAVPAAPPAPARDSAAAGRPPVLPGAPEPTTPTSPPPPAPTPPSPAPRPAPPPPAPPGTLPRE